MYVHITQSSGVAVRLQPEVCRTKQQSLSSDTTTGRSSRPRRPFPPEKLHLSEQGRQGEFGAARAIKPTGLGVIGYRQSTGEQA